LRSSTTMADSSPIDEGYRRRWPSPKERTSRDTGGGRAERPLTPGGHPQRACRADHPLRPHGMRTRRPGGAAGDCTRGRLPMCVTRIRRVTMVIAAGGPGLLVMVAALAGADRSGSRLCHYGPLSRRRGPGIPPSPPGHVHRTSTRTHCRRAEDSSSHGHRCANSASVGVAARLAGRAIRRLFARLLLSADNALRSASGWRMPRRFTCSDRPGCRTSSPTGATGPRLGWLGTSTVLTALTYLNAAGIACQLGPGGLLLVGAMTRRRGA